MRVLLQNTETKLYFVDTNEWTEDPGKAKDFEQVEHAARIYHLQDLAYASIVVEQGPPSRKQEFFGELLKYVQAQG
jgi:hypothetical protein